MKIVLWGFMCSGKTRVGKICASQLKWPHFDTDEWIEQSRGCSIADVIQSEGEAAFRRIEKETVDQISQKDNCVISTGGGVPMDADNRQKLKKQSRVIWLKISPSVVLKRAGNLKKRPMINPKRPLESVRELLKKREPYYAEADHAVSTNHRSADNVADQVMAWYKKNKT